MPRIYVAIGANLNNPKQQLDDACSSLIQLADFNSFQVSSYYRSRPMGNVEQPDYLNGVTSFTSDLTPLRLLDKLQQIELEQGRKRLVHWGPRTLDLDLLLYDNQIINHARLTVPHYGMKQRAFVLIPLFEIAPDLFLPCGTHISTLITKTMTNELKKI